MHYNALVILIEVEQFDMRRILVDVGSSENLTFLEAFRKLRKMNEDLKRVDFPLIGFAWSTTYRLGTVNHLLVLG